MMDLQVDKSEYHGIQQIARLQVQKARYLDVIQQTLSWVWYCDSALTNALGRALVSDGACKIPLLKVRCFHMIPGLS